MEVSIQKENFAAFTSGISKERLITGKDIIFLLLFLLVISKPHKTIFILYELFSNQTMLLHVLVLNSIS